MPATSMPIATPMVEINHYRPGTAIALTTLLVPLALALALATWYMWTGERAPVWIPLLLLLWFLVIPLLWLLMKSVRTTTTSIAVGRPWQRWRELNYDDIERVERRGTAIVIRGIGGERLRFTPALLRGGDRLERSLLLRLPSHVLVGELRRRAQEIIMGGPPPSGQDSLVSIQARPESQWPFSAFLFSVVMAGLAAASVFALPMPFGGVVAVVLGILCVLGLVVFVLLLQQVTIDEQGVTVSSPVSRTKHMNWADVAWYEVYLGQLGYRLRGEKVRLRFFGPPLLRRSQAVVMQALLQQYLTEGHALPVQRRGFF